VTAPLSWEEISAAPWFRVRVVEVLDELVCQAAEQADDAERFLAYVDEMEPRCPQVTLTDAGDGLVEVRRPFMNTTLVTMRSFLPGADVIAFDLADLHELPEVEERRCPPRGSRGKGRGKGAQEPPGAAT
jgi:hypothetical protein